MCSTIKILISNWPRTRSLCTDVPRPSGKIGRGDVCESPSLIVFRYTDLHKLFCSFGDSWKGTCRSKNSSGVCAQARRTSSRNVPPKNPDIRSLITIKPGARSIQPKFGPDRPGKEDHLKRWTRFFEAFPVGPNRSIEFWTEISGNFGWMDRASGQACLPRSH